MHSGRAGEVVDTVCAVYVSTSPSLALFLLCSFSRVCIHYDTGTTGHGFVMREVWCKVLSGQAGGNHKLPGGQGRFHGVTN